MATTQDIANIARGAVVQPAQPVTSVDKIALNRWRFSETNGFVVKDYTSATKDNPEPMVMVLKSTDIFEFIAEASEQKRKVAIYAIGPCVIDWS
jgi:hypothetical protein